MTKTEAEQVLALIAFAQAHLNIPEWGVGKQTVLYTKARDAAIELGAAASKVTGAEAGTDREAIGRAWPNPYDF